MRLKNTFQVINNETNDIVEGNATGLANHFGVSEKYFLNSHKRGSNIFNKYSIYRKIPVYNLIRNNELVDSNTNLNLLCLLNNHSYKWTKEHLFGKGYNGERIAITYEYE